MPRRRYPRLRLRDLLFTFLLHLYFSLGFVLAVLPRLVVARIRFCDGAQIHRVQELTTSHLRGFFWLVRLLFRVRIHVAPEVLPLRGRVLVCNHESYLDALVFVSTFRQHLTVVKPTWFRVPIFGWFLRSVGYVAPLGTRGSVASMMERIEALRGHFAQGGILYLFPEGHRSRDGRVGRFQPGAFKLARHLGVDVELLQLRGTAQLFPPGCVVLRSGSKAPMVLQHLGTITASEMAEAASLRELVRGVEQRYREGEET